MRLHGNAAVLGDAERAAEQDFGGGGAEADNDLWLNELYLVLEPGRAGPDLGGVRRLVQATRRAGVASPFEMLDRVCDVDVFSIDARRVERTIEQPAGRTDEWPAGLVFGVARLLADQ